jgi:putative nucleotidyltransferase with HDIG domain
MGSSMVRNIITSFLVKQLFRSKNKSLQKRMGEIWNHSVHVAAISHVLATRFTKFKADEVMLAGLLHDIGKLPILAKAAKLTSMQENEKVLDMVLEKLHPTLGKTILQAWKFSDEIARVAAEHENIFHDSETLDFIDVVIVANLHSYIGKAQSRIIDWQNVPAMTKLKLDPEMSIGVLEEAQEEIMEIQKVLTA